VAARQSWTRDAAHNRHHLGNLVPSARDRLETLDFDAELRLDVLIH